MRINVVQEVFDEDFESCWTFKNREDVHEVYALKRKQVDPLELGSQ